MADTVQLVREPVFTALTRPQMFAGVTYSFFIINVFVTMELFLVTKSFWAIPLALVFHGIGTIACLREPRTFDLWLLRVRRAPRTRGFGVWRCNSYRS
ncbi:MAG: VirB3 family type IV secretion system protein [Sandarakinorhabdus sp.]|nr:VirB3 family type IV secretion system protein [Sandarakinorhabdus sp.]